MTFPTGEIMFDRDATVAFRTDSVGTITATYTPTQLESLRRPDVAGNLSGYANSSRLHLYFPEPVDLSFIWENQTTGTPAVSFSKNSTAPTNGTWSGFSSGTGGVEDNLTSVTVANMALATDPTAFHASAVDVVALRVRPGTSGTGITVNYLRLWGAPSDPTSYLSLWDGTLDQPAASGLFNLGQIQQGTNKDVTFRVKNTHGSLTANNVTLSIPHDFGANNIIGGTTFEISGGGFSAPLNIGNLSAGSISSVITLRRTVGGGESLDNGLASLLLDATWS